MNRLSGSVVCMLHSIVPGLSGGDREVAGAAAAVFPFGGSSASTGRKARALAATIFFVAAVALLLAVVPAAHAGKAVDHFFPTASGSGAGAGQFNGPRGIAFNDPAVDDGNGGAFDGWFYVVDDNNHRVQVFDDTEAFQFMIGGGVNTNDGSDLCTAQDLVDHGPATCAAGSDSAVRGGGFDNPQGVAIDQSTGHFYVRDRDNLRVQEFEADGTFVRAWGWDVTVNGSASDPASVTTFQVCEAAADCKAGSSGTGAGQFQSSSEVGPGIAVDPGSGHVFAADFGSGFSRAHRIQRFQPDGQFVSSFGRIGPFFGGGAPGDFGATFGAPTGHVPRHLAAGDGILYADNTYNGGRVERYDITAGAFIAPILTDAAGGPLDSSVFSNNGLAIDPATGNLLVGRGSVGIQELDIPTPPTDGLTADDAVDLHMANSGLTANGLDVDPDSGDFYVTSSSASANRVYVLDDDGAGLPPLTINPASNVGAKTATFSGTINPEGFDGTTWLFEYSKTGLDGSWVPVGTPQSVSGTSDVDVEATATGLEPNSTYRVRLVVAKGFGAGTGTSPEVIFVTDPAAPDVTTLADRGASDDATTLAGTVNPNNSPTRYWFEYGTSTAYGARVPVPDRDIGDGATEQTVLERIDGLLPLTTYHYRLVAESSVGRTEGEDLKFTTRATVANPPLDRRYELVSPAQKLLGPGLGAHASNSALDGETGVAPGLPARSGNRFISSTLLGPVLVAGDAVFVHDTAFGQRDAGRGWTNRSAFTRRNFCSDQGAPFLSWYSASAELSLVAFDNHGRCARLFDEMTAWPGINPKYVTDWDGDWELIAPTAGDQGIDVGNWGASPPVVADDGSTMAFTDSSGIDGGVRGLLGPTDPAHGYLPNTTTSYLYDKPGGPSDTFSGRGPTESLGACAGSGAERTLIPERLASGKQSARICPLPSGVLSEAVIDARGAAVNAGVNPTRNMVSRDGARSFFMSPSPADGTQPCDVAESGLDTACPTQLYVRQRDVDGDVTVRWLSRTEVRVGRGAAEDQDASLMAPIFYQGASADGDKVFFKTTAPLTADDPNGGTPVPGGVTTGTASTSSWDLYMYDMSDGPDGDPATPDADPASAGAELTRISAGPNGTGDCNVSHNPGSSNTSGSALRFVSDAGDRAYFTCQGVLPGADVPDNGTITTPGSSDVGFTNLYAYSSDTGEESWTFVARLPRDTIQTNSLATCATTGARDIGARSAFFEGGPPAYLLRGDGNCVRGTADGQFVTFWTNGRLTADDPDAVTGDVYSYDAQSKRLERISAPQGGSGGTYTCVTVGNLQCNGDPGYVIRDFGVSAIQLGVATSPAIAGDRIAFFESRSRLVPGDVDDLMDTYQWRNGKLSLVSTGVDDDHAHYSGNDTTGESVFFVTRQKLTWEDIDAVRDAYVARAGGGFDPPTPRELCTLLADGCQGAGGAPIAPSRIETTSPSADGNVSPGARKNVALRKPSRKARRRAARRGVLAVRVKTNRAGLVRVLARAKIGKRTRRVAGRKVRVREAGAVTVKLRLNRAAKRRLRRGRTLKVTLRVSSAGARTRTATVRLKRGRRS